MTPSPQNALQKTKDLKHFQSFEGLNNSNKSLSNTFTNGFKRLKSPSEKVSKPDLQKKDIKIRFTPVENRTKSQPNLEQSLKGVSLMTEEGATKPKRVANPNRSEQRNFLCDFSGRENKLLGFHGNKLLFEGTNQKQKSTGKRRFHIKNLEAVIQRNAKKAIAEKRNQKFREEHFKQLQLQRKKQLSEENKIIRMQNLTTFGSVERPQSPKFPWGVDQRKFSHHRLGSSPDLWHDPQRPSRKYVDEKERRERLGLGGLTDNDIIRILKSNKCFFIGISIVISLSNRANPNQREKSTGSRRNKEVQKSKSI